MATRVHPRRKKPIRCLPRCKKFPHSLFLPGVHIRLSNEGRRRLCREWHRHHTLTL